MGILDFMPAGDICLLEDIDETEFYDTGIYTLNFMLGGDMFGGIPSKMNVFASPPHVGKSLIAYEIGKAFLESNNIAELLIYDTESAINRAMLMSKFGANYRRVSVIGTKQKINIVENFSIHIRKVIDGMYAAHKGGKSNLMIVIDSMNGFKSKKVITMHEEGNDTAQWHTQKILSDIMPVIANDFAELKIPVFVTAHAKPAIMAKKWEDQLKIVGVKALEFFSSNIYQMTKVKNQEDPIGGTSARCRPKKSRYCSSNFEMDMEIFYKTGIAKDAYLLGLMKKEKLITGASNSTYYGVGVLSGMSFTGASLRKSRVDEMMGMEYLKKLNIYLQGKYRLGDQVIEDVDDIESVDDIPTKEQLRHMNKAELQEVIDDYDLDYVIKKFNVNTTFRQISTHLNKFRTK